MRSEKGRIFQQTIKNLIPRKVRITTVSSNSGFCKYGRVYKHDAQSEFATVIPLNGNRNNNWKIG